ncbi:MAG: signal peptidase [Candidatus Woesearchaeota archaeon]|nr:signal peptidase [Candidatus Woesearchaeota archaeon]MDN5327546.1 signal peptidase [Candidatus Woesearchaeota archaeon]
MITNHAKTKKVSILLLLVFFLSGMIVAFLLALMFPLDSTLSKVYDSTLSVATNVLTGRAIERPSPQDWVSDKQIEFQRDKVIIYVKDPKWATFADTNSMDPVLDEGTDAIEIVPKDPSQIKPGDIIAYKSKIINSEVVHRVVKTGYDENGWYAILKGDNNPQEDPERVRFSQITRVVVALIY